MRLVYAEDGTVKGWALPAITPGQLLQATLQKHLRGNYASLSVIVFEGKECVRRVVEVH